MYLIQTGHIMAVSVHLWIKCACINSEVEDLDKVQEQFVYVEKSTSIILTQIH